MKFSLQIFFLLLHKYVKVYGYSIIFFFSSIFSKGDNFPDFLFAYLEDELFPKWGLLLKERIRLYGNKFFSRVDPMRWEANENDRVTSPESVPMHLNIFYMYFEKLT